MTLWCPLSGWTAPCISACATLHVAPVLIFLSAFVRKGERTKGSKRLIFHVHIRVDLVP